MMAFPRPLTERERGVIEALLPRESFTDAEADIPPGASRPE
jgi:hypothetical protein